MAVGVILQSRYVYFSEPYMSDELYIRYVVEQRCTKPEHVGPLGAIPVSHGAPRDAEQLLMLNAVKCDKCTFHSKFYAPKQITIIEPRNITEKKMGFIEIIIGIYCLIFLIATGMVISNGFKYLLDKNYLAFTSLFALSLSLAVNILDRGASNTTKFVAVVGFAAAFTAFWFGFNPPNIA